MAGPQPLWGRRVHSDVWPWPDHNNRGVDGCRALQARSRPPKGSHDALIVFFVVLRVLAQGLELLLEHALCALDRLEALCLGCSMRPTRLLFEPERLRHNAMSASAGAQSACAALASA
eukprot:scaffold8243_cov129-Isochrysis_galbana.AAC.13